MQSITLSKDANKDDDVIKGLMNAVMKEVLGGGQEPAEENRSTASEPDPFDIPDSPVIRIPEEATIDGRPLAPRRVEEMSNFGAEVAKSDINDLLFNDNLPQLAERDGLLVNGAPDVMNLRESDFLRQNNDGAEVENNEAADDEKVVCTMKVMEVS